VHHARSGIERSEWPPAGRSEGGVDQTRSVRTAAQISKTPAQRPQKRIVLRPSTPLRCRNRTLVVVELTLELCARNPTPTNGWVHHLQERTYRLVAV
jgi:hypothetical protein